MAGFHELVRRGLQHGINPKTLKLLTCGSRTAYFASAGLHATAAAILAVLVIPHLSDPDAPAVDLSVSGEQSLQALDLTPVSIAGSSTDPGGSRSGNPLASESARGLVADLPEARLADSSAPSVFDLDSGIPPAQELAQSILGPKIAKALGRGLGGGIGDGLGMGNGAGNGLFDSSGTAKRFVYVLDCSGSMQERDSQARDRFERLKLELVRSIGGLSESQEFFVIFFNSGAVPMPAKSLQRATLANKRKYLEWIVKVQGGGETDPTPALGLAFQLNPDLIYLLTDGSFGDKVSEAIARDNTRGVAIHTFCMGDAKGESLLRRIAADNRGVYTFVP